MFINVLLVYSCFIGLVKSQPLQGFPSYPVIQYQENYRNEQPYHVHPSDFNIYSHPHLIQNQVTPYQNIAIPYNNLVQRIYLEDTLQNEINSAVNQNCDQTQRYVHPADVFTPEVVNNYIIVPVENNARNKTKDSKKETLKCEAKISATNENSEQKKNRKCKKRKNTTKATNEKGKEVKEKCSIEKQNNRREKDNKINKQSNNEEVKVCRKKKCKNKLQSSDTPKKMPVDIEQHTKDKNPNFKSGNIADTKKKNLNKIEKVSKNTEDDIRKTSNRVKNDKNALNNRKKVKKKKDCYDFSEIHDLDDFFNIDENCAEFDNRCIRNNREDNIQKYQQNYYLPSDNSNNMSPYNMMFNPQLFDTNGYFPYNFDYLYNTQQHPNENSNASQRKANTNRRTGRRKKQKNGNRKTSDRNKQDSNQGGSCEKIVQLTPTFIEATTVSDPFKVTANTDITQIKENYKVVPDDTREEIDIPSIHDDSIEIASNVCDDSYHVYSSPVYDDYYPEFHTDNVYSSKEEFEWSDFHDRHYYSSSDKSERGRERRKYDTTYDVPIPQQENINPRNNKPLIKIAKENTKSKTSNEEIHFKTPPPLDFPDFKTEMINKEKEIPYMDMHYEPNNKSTNKYSNNKMSSYSNTKKAESYERRNKIVDQNDVETVFGHSKVVKYGAPTDMGQIDSDISNESDYSDEKDNNPYSSDGKTTIIIAKSLPYPI